MDEEDFDDIRAVCEHHAPKPDEKFAEMSPKKFVKAYVKVGFPAIHFAGHMSVEYMWVLVKAVKNGKLAGRLKNSPLFTAFAFDDKKLKKPLKHNDYVRIDRKDICEVIWPQ